MEASQEFRNDPNHLRRIVGLFLVALAVVIVVFLAIQVIRYFWHPTTITNVIVLPTVDATAQDIKPCTALSNECADVTPQPATRGVHAPRTQAGSGLPLSQNGARFAPGTDAECYYAEKYGVSCEDVKTIGRAYFRLNHPEVLDEGE